MAALAPLLRGVAETVFSNVTTSLQGRTNGVEDGGGGDAPTTTGFPGSPSAAPTATTTAPPSGDGCSSGSCPIIVTLCVLYVCVMIQCTYEYTCNKSPVRLISNLQLALATQAVVRAASIVIIFAVPAEGDAVQWRLVVLSDIPGLIFCSIFVLFCTSAMAHMFEGDKSKRRVKMSVFISTCLVVIVWFIAVAFLTGTNKDATTIADTMRMAVIGLLCVLVMVLTCVLWQFTVRTSRNDVIQYFGVDKAPFKYMCPIILVCFGARLLCLLFLQIDGNLNDAVEKWVVVLFTSTPLYTVFVVAYFLGGEVLCSVMVTCQLRYRQFEHGQQLLEQALLRRQNKIHFTDLELLSELGHGKYGVVYKATYMHCTVAVKKFKRAGGELDTAPAHGDKNNATTLNTRGAAATLASMRPEQLIRRKRFVREAQLLESLRHPKIVQYYGYTYFQNEESFAVVMEFMAGGSLYRLLHQRLHRRWTVGDAVQIGLDIIDGLDHLHRKSVIHRDLKSLNVLVDRSYTSAKICDFGLARLTDREQDLVRREGTMYGTAHWAAPEVLRGEPAVVASDVYSLGITLYEMFTRKIPYLGASPAYIRQNVRTGIMRPSTAPLCHPAFIGLVRASWAQDPEQRCTLSQLRVMLEEAARTVDGDTQIGEVRARPPRRSSRLSTHRALPPAGGAAAAAAAAAGRRAAVLPRSTPQRTVAASMHASYGSGSGSAANVGSRNSLPVRARTEGAESKQRAGQPPSPRGGGGGGGSADTTPTKSVRKRLPGAGGGGGGGGAAGPFSAPGGNRSRRRVRTVSGIPRRGREPSSSSTRTPLLQPFARPGSALGV